jgi:hypothetical protein
MKQFLSALFLICALASVGQYSNLKIDNEQVVFDKIYQADSLEGSMVKSFLISSVPKLKDVKDILVSDEIITAKIRNAEIDFKKYGGKWANTPVFLLHPMNADVSFYWKNGRYRVLLSSIEFLMPTLGNTREPFKLTDIITKNGTFSTGKMEKRSGEFLNQYFEDWFTLEKQKDW